MQLGVPGVSLLTYARLRGRLGERQTSELTPLHPCIAQYATIAVPLTPDRVRWVGVVAVADGRVYRDRVRVFTV